MKLLIQRVGMGEVRVEGKVVGRIGKGLLIYVGFEKGDTPQLVEEIVERVVNLKIFGERWERSVLEEGGEVLLISNFTLPGRPKGKKFNFSRSLDFEKAKQLYHFMAEKFGEYLNCQTGQFGAMMEVESLNDGPVNLLLEKGAK